MSQTESKYSSGFNDKDLVKKRLLYQNIASIPIISAGNTGSVVANTNISYKYVTGCVVTIQSPVINAEVMLQNSVFNRFQIDSLSVFSDPEPYEAKLLMFTQNLGIAPFERYYRFEDSYGNVIPYRGNNSQVNIQYTDGSFLAALYPYTVNVWLRLENLDEEYSNFLTRFAKFMVNNFTNYEKNP